METWRDIEGLEGCYQVSNYGRVKSLAHTVEKNYTQRTRCKGVHTIKEAFKSIWNHTNGYKMVTIKGKKYYVHRLVANAFIENPNNLKEVNHINGDKANNLVSNLEWVTRSENQKHASDVLMQRIGEKNPSAKLTTDQVEYIKNNYIRYNKEFGIAALAKKFNVCNQTISYIVNGHSRNFG